MRESIDSLYRVIDNENYLTCLEDKEYEYKVSGQIIEIKGLFGFKEMKLEGPDPKEVYNSLNSSINKVVQFCKKYGLPYEVSEYVEYDKETASFSGGRRGRMKNITREIVFTVTSEVAQKLLHDYYANRTNRTSTYLIQRSGNWYDSLKNSQAVKAVAAEMISYIEKYIENENDKSGKRFSFDYQCNRRATIIDDLYNNKQATIDYEKLGYECLGSKEQEAAVTAAVIPYILKEYKNRKDIFDIMFEEASTYNNYNTALISITLKSDEANVKKPLKSW